MRGTVFPLLGLLLTLAACAAPGGEDSVAPPWGEDAPDPADIDSTLSDEPSLFGGPCYLSELTLLLSPGETLVRRFTPPSWPYDLSAFAILQAAFEEDGVSLEAALSPSLLRTDATSAPDPDAVPLDTPGTWYAPTLSWYTSALALDTPLRLEEGESVFLSFHHPGTSSARAGVMTCAEDPVPDGTQWYASEPEAPYTWTDLSTVGEVYRVPFWAVVTGSVVEGA